ncbi:MAG: tetratricopeptide repeat protein [Elusimicrobia bacterium]|nr:tetratricopeptide repeat protein [Elusimicrobiota bacterium]
MALTRPGRRTDGRLGSKLLLALVSLCLTLAALEAALRAGGAVMRFLHERGNSLALRRQDGYRIMCLGESTTWNEYPRFLEGALNSRMTGMRFSVIDKGIPGGNTTDILARLAADLEEYHPDMVVAMMGVNDFGIRYGDEVIDPRNSWYKHFRLYRWARLWWLYASRGRRPPPPAPALETGGVFAPPDHPAAAGPPPEPAPRRPPPSPPPGRGFAFIQSARAAMSRRDYARAEESYAQALRVDPEDAVAYNELGVVYQSQGKFTQAERAFQRSIRLGSGRVFGGGDPCSGLARIYNAQGRAAMAEKMFKQAAVWKPWDARARFELAGFYKDHGDDAAAERWYQKALELDPENDWACAALGLLYSRTGRGESARRYQDRARELRARHSPVTVRNYLRLKELLDAKGIRLVCVQYPMLSAAPLQRIFAEHEDEPLFVDNEAVFREAVRRESYAEYFRDLFGGDFGHCTPKGNQLLADNIAQAILRRYFRR